MNRRDFLKAGAAAAVAATAFGPYVAYAADQKPLRVGLIGAGWYGKCDAFRLIQVAPVEVVSVCDVDKRQLAEAADLIAARQASKKKPRQFTDYRELLKERDLDIAIVGTPDHWHALPMIAACEAGADVYVQKPISVDVREGEAMLAAARKHNRVVQVGMQRRSTPHLIDAREKVIKAGLLGTIGHVDICCYYHMRARDNPPVSKPPEYFDYDLWTGPAPLRPYDAPARDGQDPLPHKRWWRAFNEYSNGIVGDMCVHMLDMVRWMLDLGWPTRISSAGGIFVERQAKSNITDTQTATFEFDKPKLNVAWVHRTWGTSPDPDYPWAAFIYGDKGTLKASTQKWEFIPSGKREPTLSAPAAMEPDKYPEEKTERDFEAHAAVANRWHMKDFLAAREARGTDRRPVSDIEQGHISTAACILANHAMTLGRTLTWDPAKAEVVGDAEANKLLKRPYRSGWTHPAGG